MQHWAIRAKDMIGRKIRIGEIGGPMSTEGGSGTTDQAPDTSQRADGRQNSARPEGITGRASKPKEVAGPRAVGNKDEANGKLEIGRVAGKLRVDQGGLGRREGASKNGGLSSATTDRGTPARAMDGTPRQMAMGSFGRTTGEKTARRATKVEVVAGRTTGEAIISSDGSEDRMTRAGSGRMTVMHGV